MTAQYLALDAQVVKASGGRRTGLRRAAMSAGAAGSGSAQIALRSRRMQRPASCRADRADGTDVGLCWCFNPGTSRAAFGSVFIGYGCPAALQG